MKYGVQLAGGAAVCGRDALREVAAAAEGLGYDSLLIGDHIVIPKRINAPWPYDEYVGGKTPYGVYTEMEWLDPFDTMAFLAGVTQKARLGISVLIVPYRHPFDVARRVATVDVLSSGRFVLGVGVGWLEEEFRLLGIPFKERAQRTREYIAMMKALWTEEKPRFAGKFVQLDEDVNVLPRPVQKPHPPIWVGGESQPALKRVVEFGDGWHIGLILPERIGPRIEQLKKLMEQAGRDFAQLEITALAASGRTSPAEIRAYRDAGVHVLYMLPLSRDTRALLGEMREFAEQMKTVS
jgi:probable F420-dependent oxidoreductase